MMPVQGGWERRYGRLLHGLLLLWGGLFVFVCYSQNQKVRHLLDICFYIIAEVSVLRHPS